MRNKLTVLLALSIVLGSSIVNAQVANTPDNKEQQRYFDINKNIEIYNSILRDLDMFYVDSLDVNKSVRVSIDNMLSGLDPYTEYFSDEGLKTFNSIISGEYGGIGAGVGYKDGKVIITEPFEGKPAQKAGLKAGDIILEIDGKDMTVCDKVEGESLGQTLSSFVSSSLKGQPGTSLQIKIERPGEKKPIVMKIVREKIMMDPIPYYGLISPTVGYINFPNTFTDKCAMEIKKAFLDLKKQGMTSLVFDIRQNGGGVVEEAVQIVNLFVAKGKIVLSTKGRLKQAERTYRTTLEPIDTDIPIIILVDRRSASASEIVAGSLQDMDRAVLIGERTFGKGLVQSPRDVPFGGVLKITTAKYYIPSGRCIQAIDYSHHNSDGSARQIPDSLTNIFYTQNGRPVRDGGGIAPDIVLEEEKTPTIIYYLANQYIIFDWATDWVLKNKNIGPAENFSISDEDYENFKAFVKSKDFQYDRMSEKTMASLKEVMEFEGYSKTAEAELKALEAKLVPDLNRDLETFKEDIKQQINTEIAKRYYYQKGEYIMMLKKDGGVKKAIEVLNDENLYKETLSAANKNKEADAQSN